MGVESQERPVNYPLQHLKLFELYYGGTSELELVKFFSENATSLEKIVIIPQEYIHLPHSSSSWQMDDEQFLRECAKQQLRGLLASHDIELKILQNSV